jgi:uncharacterized protein YceH (UPF0502 family)
LNLGRRELAVLCELMLRGPQTLGELRSRTERMHSFGDLEELESVLDHMQELVVRLPRRPGEKEARYTHLLSGEPPPISAHEADAQISQPSSAGRLSVMEDEVARLRAELDDLKKQFAGFQKQFE